MQLDTILSGVVFFTVSGGLMALHRRLEARLRRARLAKRLQKNAPAAGGPAEAEADLRNWHGWIASLGIVAAPKTEEELAGVRNLLVYAGYRTPDAPVIYFGIKLGLCLLFGIVYLAAIAASGSLSPQNLLLVFIPLAAGYYLPGLGLKVAAARRQQKIFKELPDALDLLLICIEAGLSFDMALFRISREFSGIAPVLAKEFGQYYLEIQGGLPRRQVLTNLARRNGVGSLSSVVNVLNQSARFGTDIAEALRVYIQSMRTERRHLAEEKGAKLSTHLTFPMVLLILPALLLIILGPAIINLSERLQAGF